MSPPLARKHQNVAIPSPSTTKKRKINHKIVTSDNVVKIETYGQSLHVKLKELHKKNNKRAEIPMWVELSHKYRRESIEKSSDVFLELFYEFNYLSDIQYVKLFLIII